MKIIMAKEYKDDLKEHFCIIDDTRPARYGEYSLNCFGVLKLFTGNNDVLWMDGCYPILATDIIVAEPLLPVPEMFNSFIEEINKAGYFINSVTEETGEVTCCISVYNQPSFISATKANYSLSLLSVLGKFYERKEELSKRIKL